MHTSERMKIIDVEKKVYKNNFIPVSIYFHDIFSMY